MKFDGKQLYQVRFGKKEVNHTEQFLGQNINDQNGYFRLP